MENTALIDELVEYLAGEGRKTRTIMYDNGDFDVTFRQYDQLSGLGMTINAFSLRGTTLFAHSEADSPRVQAIAQEYGVAYHANLYPSSIPELER